MEKERTYIGEGYYGTCYRINDTTVRKYYKDIIPKTQLDTIGTKNETFIFAQNINLQERYTEMPYVEGIPLVKVNPTSKQKYFPMANPKINDFMRFIPDLYCGAKRLDKKHIFIHDFCAQNILCTEEGFKVIDTDLYYKLRKRSYNYNIYCINNGLNDCIFSPIPECYEPIEKLILESNSLSLISYYKKLNQIRPDNEIFIDYFISLLRLLEIENETLTIQDVRKRCKGRVKR